MKSIRYLIIFAGLFLLAPLSAQTFEEYKKQQEEAMKKLATEQQKGIENLQKEFEAYVSKRDQEWSDYLEKEWKNFNAFKANDLPQKPKPKTPPVCDVKPVAPVVDKPVDKPTETPKPKPDEKPVVKSADKPAEPLKPEPVVIIPPQPVETPPVPVQLVEPIRKPATEEDVLSYQSINFYGKMLKIGYLPELSKMLPTEINQKSIAQFWDHMSQMNYTPLVERLLQTKTDVNINDYGYFLIVKKFSEMLYPNQNNISRLLTWFLMVRSGYNVRVAFYGNEVALLLPANQTIYQVSYLTLNNNKYFIIPELPGSKYLTYEKDYAANGKMIDMNISSPLNLAGRKAEKLLRVNFEDRDYPVAMSYDPDLIDFFDDYPLADLDVSFNAATSAIAKESLAQSLKPIISNMNKVQAANFLLKFVQTAFQYKTDPEQFNREKYFFAEELFYYPFCDCEDRSVLYAYLVRELLGLKVIGLEYPDHVATAISLKDQTFGDMLDYNGEKYVVSDPTYINAPVGLGMPNYKGIIPKLCYVNQTTSEKNDIATLWDEYMALGLKKGSNQKNAVRLKDGSVVLTGYFEGAQLKLKQYNLQGNPAGHTFAVVRINQSGDLVWAKSIVSSINAVGLHAEVTPQGNLVMVGNFAGNIMLNGKSLKAGENTSDNFVVQYNQNGQMMWINKIGLGDVKQEDGLAYTCVFDATGNRKALNFANEQVEQKEQGLYPDEQGNIFYTGMTTGLLASATQKKVTSLAAGSALDIPELLYAESAKCEKESMEKYIAGIVAAVKVVKDMGLSLTGAQMLKSISKDNPGFAKSCPNIYANLGKINFVKNAQGVITIKTTEGSDISFDKVKIKNNSTISITELKNGDYKIDVLSGIKVGKLVVWYGLNYIKMIVRKGDLLFDYDTDNSQATVNVRKDILN